MLELLQNADDAAAEQRTRFKRAGQFWTEPGDEKILCLCADRMSGRWQELRPHLEAA